MTLYQRGLMAPYRRWAKAEVARVGMEHAAIAGPETPATTPARIALAFGLLALAALAVGGLWWKAVVA